MHINSIWERRFREFYIEMTKYISIIAMSIFYSFLIFGGIFAYYYFKLLNWLPPSFPTEIFASLFISFMFLQTRIRTFLKKADIIFLVPTETSLSLYFRNSIFYSAFSDIIRLLIMIVIISPLINAMDIFSIIFLISFLGLAILNFRLVWIEQWLNSKFQYIGQRLFRFLAFSAILYFMFMGSWEVAAIWLVINYFLWFLLFKNKTKGLNWEYLISQEEKSLVRIYIFINIFIDVPHLKHSFNRRKFLSWCLKKVLTYKQSATYLYLYSFLFIRYDEFYFLYLRLTVIGFGIIYLFPTYGWIVTFVILFLSGYQLLPLQYSINDSSRLYPLPTYVIKQSFQKLVMILLTIQLVLINSANFMHTYPTKMILFTLLEMLFIFWFVYFFTSKRIMKEDV